MKQYNIAGREYTEHTTDKSKSGIQLTQIHVGTEISITSDWTGNGFLGIKSKDFNRFKITKHHSPIWLGIEIMEFKNNRTKHISIEIDKEQAEMMLKKLSEMISEMVYEKPQ